MKDILIKIDTKTSRVTLPTDVLGITGENLQGKLKFQLSEWIEGQPLLLVHQEYDGETHDSYVEMNIDEGNKIYYLEIKNSLLKGWKVDLQLQITEEDKGSGIPVFKSNMFYLKVEETLDASTTIPDEYPTWIETANEKIVEINEAITLANQTAVDLLEQAQSGAFDGEQGPQGIQGEAGNDALINGVNTLSIVAGKNVLLNQVGDTLEIGSEAEVPEGTVIDENYVHTDNNYTTEEKEKLANLENYDDTEIRKIIANINQFEVQVVDILPALGETKIMYLVPKTGEDTDIYDEYLFINDAWEHIGSTQIDLTNYYNKTEADTLLANKQDAGNYPNYKGHVSSVDLLPTAGQPSGENITPTCNIADKNYNNLFSLYYTDLEAFRTEATYFICLELKEGSNSRKQGIILMTEYPEQIKFACSYVNITSGSSKGQHYFPRLYVEYDENKPVYYASKNTDTTGYGPYLNNSTNLRNKSKTLITENCYFNCRESIGTGDFNISGDTYFHRMPNNLPTLKYSNIYGCKTLTNSANSYYWNDSMIFSKCTTGNYQDTKYYTNESELDKNELYSVGENYDLYYVNNELSYEEWSKSSSIDTYTKEEIDAMIGTANTELESIINGG